MSTFLPPEDGSVVEKVVEKPIPSPLRDDPSPALNTDLDAQGHDVKNVRNIECVTINGAPPGDDFDKKLKVLSDGIKGLYAERRHRHPDLDQAIDDLHERINKPQEKFAKERHEHTLKDVSGTVPLARIERGGEIQNLLRMKFAWEGHVHPREILPNEFGGLGQDISKLSGCLHLENGKPVCKDCTPEVTKKDLLKLEHTLRAEIRPPKEEPLEIVTRVQSKDKIVVPKKCDGKRIFFSAWTLNEEAADVTLSRKGQVLSPGDTVFAHDFVTIQAKEPCYVCFLFR